jgi:hypothetical protein
MPIADAEGRPLSLEELLESGGVRRMASLLAGVSRQGVGSRS